MAAPTDAPRRRSRTPGRGRILLIGVAIIVFLLFTSLRQIAEFWTDYLWFDSVGFSDVWSHSLFIKIELGAIFTVVFFVALWVNLLVVERVSPKFRPLGPDEELLHRYHQMMDRRAGSLRLLVSALFAVIIGAGMSSQWNEWILFREGGDFGTVDPQFGMDVGFYVFKLPFLVNVVDWLFAAQVIILLITALSHYLNGGIRLQAPFERVTPQVKAHLSVLLALLALTKAADYYLQRFEILFSDRSSVVNGATATEINAQLPALTLLLIIAFCSFLLFIANIRRRGWVLPIIAVGIWALVQVSMGEIYPAFYEKFIVTPEQSSKEFEPIQNNIAATRAAYGLDHVDVKNFDASNSSDEATKAVHDNAAVTRNIQLLDPKIINDTFQKLQSKVSPSAFPAVDTDRYPMRVTPGGAPVETQVVVSNREVNPDNIPQKSWEGRVLSYTHGYGLALAAGNAVTLGGSPAFSVYDIPLREVSLADSPTSPITPAIDLNVDQPNNYYFNPENGITLNYSIVDTGAPEFDYVKQSDNPSEAYHGNGGVPLDSFARRIAFSLKFNEPYIAISQYITDQSRILYLRAMRDRVEQVAPFLSFDSDPYPVVVNGHTDYIIDAYTTSAFYPNSQRYTNAGVLGIDPRTEPFNYMRNSVKAKVDTHDGSITLYIVDTKDPVIAAYQAAFPSLFKEAKEISTDLRAHLRYPEDIFRVQTDMWGRYHLTDPNDFYKKENAWEPAPAGDDKPANSTSNASNTGNAATPPAGQNPVGAPAPTVTRAPRMDPQYVINRLQGDADANFMLTRSFQPFSDNDSKNQLTAFMVARCDGDDLGRLQVYQMPSKDLPDGPGIVNSLMNADTAVSSAITQLNQQGSSVRYGALTMVPFNRSLIYVRSLYVVANGSQQVPLVSRVIVSFNKNVKIGRTLQDALNQLLPGSNAQTLEGAPDLAGSDISAPPDTSNTPGTTTPGTEVNNGTSVPNNGTSVPNTSTSNAPDTTLVPGNSEKATLANGVTQDLVDANAALADHNLGLYQQKINEATDKMRRLQALLAAESTPTDSTTTTSGPSAATTTTAPSS